MKTKGIVLAGGTGSRMSSVSHGKNKHLLDLAGKPVICYPLGLLRSAGITEIMIVTTPEAVPEFRQTLGGGLRFGLSLSYAVQSGPLGIAHAMKCARDFVGKDHAVVLLGDNVFGGVLVSSMLRASLGQPATIFAKPMACVSKCAVVELTTAGEAKSLDEKPLVPLSHMGVTGLYSYRADCFDRADRCPLSERGEYEITSINQSYLDEGLLSVRVLPEDVPWFDVGTPECFQAAEHLMLSDSSSYFPAI